MGVKLAATAAKLLIRIGRARQGIGAKTAMRSLVDLAGFRRARGRNLNRAWRPEFTAGPRSLASELEPRAVMATLQAGFSLATALQGLPQTTSMDFAPDGRLFVSLKDSAVIVVNPDGVPQTQPFATFPLDITVERGIQGVAVDPDYLNNHYVYVYYSTNDGSIHNRVSRVTAQPTADGSGVVMTPGSEVQLINLPAIDPTRNPYHNGGSLHFGPDGKLYIGVGDHDQKKTAKSLNSTFGKILRVNTDGSIPTDNPFYNQTTGINRAIYARGLRNPFTTAFQPQTGRFFANDVGAGLFEEINDIVRGGDYGWPDAEGIAGKRDPRGIRNPLYLYQHGPGAMQGCAIVGGVFVPDSSAFPSEYRGDYLFADYCQGTIRRLDMQTGQVTNFATGVAPGMIDLDFGPDGQLHYLASAYNDLPVRIGRISFAENQPPRVVMPPQSQIISIGGPAQFQVNFEGQGPLAVQWQRDDQDIPGATGPTYILPSATLADDNAKFRAIVSNSLGATTSAEATLSVTASKPPQAVILSPTAGQKWKPGQTIRFRGMAIDPEDGGLAASQYTWRIDFHHNEHTHPFVAPFSNSTGGSFRTSKKPHAEGTIWYRIHLTVTDSSGLSVSTFRDLRRIRSRG